MKHKIEVVKLSNKADGYGVKISGKLYEEGFLDYEAIACKEQLEMIPDLVDDIIAGLNKRPASDMQEKAGI